MATLYSQFMGRFWRRICDLAQVAAASSRIHSTLRSIGYGFALLVTLVSFFVYTWVAQPRSWCHVPNFNPSYIKYDISPYALAFMLIAVIFGCSFSVLRSEGNIGHKFTVLTLIYAMASVTFALIYYTFGITYADGDLVGNVSDRASDYLYFSLMNSLTFHEMDKFVECDSLRFIVFFQKLSGPLFGFFYLNLATMGLSRR